MAGKIGILYVHGRPRVHQRYVKCMVSTRIGGAEQAGKRTSRYWTDRYYGMLFGYLLQVFVLPS